MHTNKMIIAALGVMVTMMAVMVNGAINPTPETYVVPSTRGWGIVSIGLARNSSVLMAVVYGRVYAIQTLGDKPMLLTSQTVYQGGYSCGYVTNNGGGDYGLLSYNQDETMVYTSYSLDDQGNINVQYEEPLYVYTSIIDNIPVTCSQPINNNNGMYFTITGRNGVGNNTSNLYWLSTTPRDANVTRIGALTWVPRNPARHNIASINVIPSSSGGGTRLIATNEPIGAGIDTNEPVLSFALPSPSFPSARDLAPDEIDSQVVNLYGGSQGWLITTLRNNTGVRIVCYDYDAMRVPQGGSSIVDYGTVHHGTDGSKQRVMVERAGSCAYIVGTHASSTRQQPVVTLTQWRSNSPLATPQKIDQVAVKLRGASANGIVGLQVSSATGYVYMADGTTVYRFRAQCP